MSDLGGEAMRCCGTEGRDEGPASATEAVVPACLPAAVLAIADATPPRRAVFAGGRSHVGTDRPMIPHDGEGPRRPVMLAPFEVETVPVTNARFAAFAAATGF